MSIDTKSNGPAPDGSRARLQELFDAYGSETGRWPAEGRQLYAAHAVDPAVCAMAQEAGAFERLLALSDPVADPARLDRLADRIVATAVGSSHKGKGAPNVLPFVARSLETSSSARVVAATRRAAYAALAASLLFGVLVGTSGAGSNAISYLTDQSSSIDEEVAASSVFSPATDEVL